MVTHPSSNQSEGAVSLLDLTAAISPNIHANYPPSKEKNKQTVWLQPFGSINTQSNKGNLRGSDYQTIGVLGGYEYHFETFDLGGLVGYGYTHFSWHEQAGKGNINQVYGGIYGDYFSKYLSIDLATILGYNFYKTNRNIK